MPPRVAMRIRTAGNECAVLASSDRRYLGCLDMHDGDIPLTDTRLAASRCNGFDYSTGQAPIRPPVLHAQRSIDRTRDNWPLYVFLGVVGGVPALFITGRFFYRYHASKERP